MVELRGKANFIGWVRIWGDEFCIFSSSISGVLSVFRMGSANSEFVDLIYLCFKCSFLSWK